MTSQGQFEALCRPGASFKFRFLFHHDPLNQIANISQERLKFWTVRRFTSGQTADFLVPTSPRKTGHDDRNHGSSHCKKPKRKEHESSRLGFTPIRVA